MNKSNLTQSVLQHPTDLVFAVTDDNVLNLLTVLKTQTITIGHYTVHFAIIGESHCITVFHGNDFVLQEVLACTDIPEILQAQSHKFAKLEPYQHNKQGYHAHVWFADVLQDQHSQSDDELALNFPKMYGQIPFTRIQWQVANSGIQWRTIHVYPLQTHTTYVYTESTLDLTERDNNERINRTHA